MEDNNKYFYCYSNRMHNFLQIFGVPFIGEGINKKTGSKYFKYLKSSRLDLLIEEWNKLKDKISLQEVVKKTS